MNAARKENVPPEDREQVLIETNKKLKVILADCCVPKNLRQSSTDIDRLVVNTSIMSLHDSSSSDGEADKSVIFVKEEKPSHEMNKIAELQKENRELKHRNNKLEIHVNALQKLFRLEDENRRLAEELEATKKGHAMSPSIVNGLDVSFNEQWAEKQINAWTENGELNDVLDDLNEYVFSSI